MFHRDNLTDLQKHALGLALLNLIASAGEDVYVYTPRARTAPHDLAYVLVRLAEGKRLVDLRNLEPSSAAFLHNFFQLGTSRAHRSAVRQLTKLLRRMMLEGKLQLTYAHHGLMVPGYGEVPGFSVAVAPN